MPGVGAPAVLGANVTVVTGSVADELPALSLTVTVIVTEVVSFSVSTPAASAFGVAKALYRVPPSQPALPNVSVSGTALNVIVVCINIVINEINEDVKWISQFITRGQCLPKLSGAD